MNGIRKSAAFIILVAASVLSLHAQDVIITSITSTPVTCGDGSDGTITVTVSGGVGGQYNYLLIRNSIPVESVGPVSSNTWTFTGHIKHPTYVISVSDEGPGSGPTGDGFATTSIDGPEPIEVTSYNATDITCNGAGDGTITVTASGEGGNYIFDLAGPVNQSNPAGFFENLPGGDYTVTVSDADGCPSTDITPVLTVNDPTPVSVALDGIVNVECNGDNTGSISITPSGGTPGGGGTGYTYSWTGPGGFTSTSEDLINVAAGDYSVTVFDANGCSASLGPLTVNQPDEISAVLNSSSDVSCNGGTDGAAEITVSGGAGGYTFSWDGQFNGLVSTDEDPINLPADSYDLTIFDASGCEVNYPSFLVIQEPDPFLVDVDGTTDVSCAGGNDGDAQITPDGGTPPYTYAWNGAVSGYTSSDEDPLDMPADDYSLTLTDSRGCSQLFPNLLTIDEPTPIDLTLTGTTDVTCFGGSDGGAGVNVTGGSPPYLFEWIGDATAHISGLEDPDDLVADTYDLTVTDNNGCIVNFDNIATIGEPAQLEVTVDNITDVACNGGATGAIEITPSGGTPPYSFDWSGPGGFTATAEDISNLETGTYSLTLTDLNGCTWDFVDLATVDENTPIEATYTFSQVSCNGGADGAINASVSGGVAPYTYNWSGPAGFTSTSEDISSLVAGTYQLTVTDLEGCIEVFPSQTLTEPDPVSASAVSTDIDCFGAGNGSVDLAVGGGVPPYTFNWSGPGGFTSTDEDLTGLGAGSYSVEVTDANLCTTAFPDIATVGEPAELQASSVKTDISCAGDDDGTIEVTVTGGIPPYNYSWTGPGGFSSTEEDLTGLAAGTYNLTVTDANGCVLDLPGIETIAEGSAIIVSVAGQTDLLCNGEPTGAVDIDVSGGAAPYIFNWSGPGGFSANTEDLSNVPAGAYSLEVTDQNGCSASYPDLAVLSEPDPLVSTLSGTGIVCYGDGNGSIEVTTTGGTPPYEYSRIGDIEATYQPGNTFGPLGPGFYTIWTRDANLCVVTDTITITEPDEIQVLGETKSGQNLCFGDSSARISIDQVTGGVEPYEYSINGGADFSTEPVFSNLPAGSYQTVVRDANGCTASGNLNVITQPTAIRITFFLKEDITSCSYAPEGRITVNGTGGKGSLTYWLDGNIQSAIGDFQNLEAGPHLVELIDENGCVKDTTVTILAPPPLVVQNLVITDVTGCTGNTSGSLEIAGSGGTGTIQYSLDGGAFQPAGLFSGLGAGNHLVTLKDDNDCTLDTLVFLDEPAPITLLSDSVVPITCNGAADGEITVTAGGGTAPLTYTLEPGSVTNGTGIFSGLAPDTYTITVDDAEGCGPVTSAPLILSEPPELLLDTVVSGEISCFGSSDGTIAFGVSGGIPPYEYSVDGAAGWSSDSLFTGLGPDTYELFVRDANLCILSGGQVELTEPAEITITVSTTDITPCAGDSTGIIDATASGGTGPLQYSLDGLDYSGSGLFADLTAGDYTLYVRDSTGCQISGPVALAQPDSVTAEVTKVDATLGNPGAISISGASGGTPPYQYSISGDTGIFSAETVYTDLEAGLYEVVVRDVNGCTYRELVEIRDVLPLDVEVIISQVSCHGEPDGSIEMIPQDAVGAVGYSIDSGENFVLDPLFENLPGDSTYYLVAIDALGKVFFDSVILMEPAPLEISALVTPAQCNRFSETGEIELTVTGGTGSYNYLWSDDSTSGDRQNLEPGTYRVEVTDENECTVSEVLEVTPLVTVMADAGADTTVCFGDSVQLLGEGGFTATWDSSMFLSRTDIHDPFTRPLTQTTTFVLTITEDESGYGCYDRDSVTVSLHPPTGLSTINDTLILSGGSVELETSGGPFSQYLWTPATGLDDPLDAAPLASPQVTTRYVVEAINEFGCEESDSVLIEVVEDLEVYNVFSPNGDGINDYFEIENAERFPEMVVEVYSRWGDLLFQSKGYDDSSRWDGTTRGTEAPVGTYYYIVIPFSEASPITGTVTIIR